MLLVLHVQAMQTRSIRWIFLARPAADQVDSHELVPNFCTRFWYEIENTRIWYWEYQIEVPSSSTGIWYQILVVNPGGSADKPNHDGL